MKTIKLLEKAIANGLSNTQIAIYSEQPYLSFEKLLGKCRTNGQHHPTDRAGAGVYIFGEENFIDIPDTIFVGELGKTGFYALN